MDQTKITDNEIVKFQYIIPKEQIKKYNSIKLTNRLGQFSFEKNESQWNLSFPRELPAAPRTMNRFFSMLENIKINKLLKKDKYV